MKTLRTRVRRYGFFAVLGITVCSLFYIADGLSSHIVPFTLFAAITVVTAAFALRALCTLKSARLIAENELLHVCPAVIRTENSIQPGSTAMEVSISCFGILLNTQVIRFNRKANRLRRVEIGRDMIVLIYGTDAQMEKTAILHEPMDRDAAQSIARQFRFETGAESVLYGFLNE